MGRVKCLNKNLSSCALYVGAIAHIILNINPLTYLSILIFKYLRVYLQIPSYLSVAECLRNPIFFSQPAFAFLLLLQRKWSHIRGRNSRARICTSFYWFSFLPDATKRWVFPDCAHACVSNKRPGLARLYTNTFAPTPARPFCGVTYTRAFAYTLHLVFTAPLYVIASLFCRTVESLAN